MQVSWNKCVGDIWCDIINLNLDHKHFDNLKGVYIIWSGENVIRLGSGIIKNRLKEHRENNNINKYPNLKVTWAQINANQMEGVEAYLAEKLNPVVGERFPDCPHIVVNFPW